MIYVQNTDNMWNESKMQYSIISDLNYFKMLMFQHIRDEHRKRRSLGMLG